MRFSFAAAVCMLLAPLHSTSATTCADLVNLKLGATTITAAEDIPAGAYTPPGGGAQQNLPAFCRVAFIVEPQIHAEVWMPKENWNERYRGEGGGGYAGSISYAGLAAGIRAGYATASTDTGHPASVGGNFALNPDGTLNNQLIGDFAERSLREMAVKSKALINAYYSKAPKYSYWNGCSTGGRQGLMAVQRFPEEYDGLVIGAPAINWDRFIPAELWPAVAMKEHGGPISNAKLTAVANAVTAACDATDGVTDGVINDPRKCNYDPAALVCKTGSDAATCLTSAEVDAVKEIWNGPVAKNGQRLWFGLERGAPLNGLAGTSPFPIASSHFQWIHQDPKFDWKTVTEASFESEFRESQRKFNQVIGTDETNLKRFRDRGGKMIIWHGEADTLIMPRGTVNYFNKVVAANGGSQAVNDFARLFLAPGVGHCAGGSGPNPVGTFEAVVKWVESGVAPDTLQASRALPGGGTRTRPLCAYPKTARYSGTGSTDDAANFVCVDGQQDARDFRVSGDN
jgi:hypothetical protein